MGLRAKILFFFLLNLPALALAFSQGKKDTFDVDKSKLVGLYCYQCNSVSSEQTPICDSAYFASANIATKLNMLIQCPSDCVYCLKKMTKVKRKVWRTERACGTQFDSLGQTVRPGCMIEKNLSVCVCTKNLCNGGRKISAEIWGLLGIYFFRKFG